jgi:TolB-like protein
LRLLAELQRRNVFRMAGLYVVGAWLIVQVAETLLPIFDTPGWVLKALVVLLAIGFLPALVFSWLFELTPEGLKRDAEVDPARSIAPHTAQRMDRLIFVGLIALIGVIAADRYWPRAGTVTTPDAAQAAADAGSTDAARSGSPESRQENGAVSNAAAPAIEPGSIAVLPFVNMSADKENEYFSDGISEELLNVLVKVEGLSVASRTSSFAYKGREISAANIGSELKVANVLEGSVRKSGNRVRITAQLIDTGSDRHLWSETFDRELTDIFAIQDEIAKAIVDALRDTLGDKASAATVSVQADTDNLDAYQLYLKARELFLTREKLDESVKLFERVVSLDPDFARGWEGLAVVCSIIIDWKQSYPNVDPSALLARASVAADRALELDPSLSMPWAARSLVATYAEPFDHAKVLELVDRAIAVDARNATAILLRGIQHLSLGFFDRGLADFDRCLAIDPAYGNCLRWKAVAVLFQGDADEALDLYEQGMARGFNPNRGNHFVEPLIRRGDVFAARLLMRELRWPLEVQQVLVAALADASPPSDVAALVHRYPEFERGQFQWGLMLRDYVLAHDGADLRLTMVEHWDPAYEGLRATPEFKRLLMRFNVHAYWRAHGFPPQCRPLGESDFDCESAGTAP